MTKITISNNEYKDAPKALNECEEGLYVFSDSGWDDYVIAVTSDSEYVAFTSGNKLEVLNIDLFKYDEVVPYHGTVHLES